MGKFDILTKHLPTLVTDNYGDWIFNNKTNNEDVVQAPFIRYSEAVLGFIEDFGRFQKKNEYYDYFNYREILKQHQIEWSQESMCSADVTLMDAEGVLALIMGAIQSGNFCEGALLTFFKIGAMQKWLLRLKELDEAQSI